MRLVTIAFGILVGAIGILSSFVGRHAAAAQAGNDLRPASTFNAITEPAARSRALFVEAAKVMTSPRCMNCHPAGEHPLQGDEERIHQPAVFRGDSDDGVPGLTCTACHTARNFTLSPGEASYQSIPGVQGWRLAPIEMAWQGRSLGELCRLVKDPARNGGRSLALLQDHMARDEIVGWAWNPGEGRKPAPGSQQEFGNIIQAWIDSGAECP